MRRCDLCRERFPECLCNRQSVWFKLASLPTWQQWSMIIFGYFALIVLALMVLTSKAHAQTSVPRNAAQITWTSPTKNTDGTDIPAACATGITQCGKLTLHRIEYGTCNAGAFGTKQGEITVVMPSVTAQVSNLVVQTYCFQVFARNDYSVESDPSTVATKIITPPKPSAPLLSTNAVAYEIRPNTQGVLIARRLGVIPLGTQCANDGSVTVDNIEYHRVNVPHGTLDLISWPADLPVTDVWAVCG